VFCLPTAFLRDLEEVYEADGADDSSPEELDRLGARLDKWGRDCEERLRKAREKLHPDHPVKCPISLFRTMDLGRHEVAHTRALAWLLDPRGEHGFENVLVNALLGQVHCSGEQPAFYPDRVAAERFYRISEGEDAGRTDVWIEGRWGKSRGGGRGLVVIEAKIDALEGEGQLARYNSEIAKWREEQRVDEGNVCRVFLTPAKGREASTGKHWKALSFSKLARAFCDAADSLRNKPGHHYLRFYVAGVLKDILGLPTGQSPAHRHPGRYALLKFLEES
jgi:hypothetical protein